MTNVVLTALLLAAGPAVFPAPTQASLEHCASAACTTLDEVRVCKCAATQEEANDLLVVDRAPEHRVIWPIAAPLGTVSDFVVLRDDLDGDGHPELLVANRASESSGVAVRTWQVSIVDGVHDAATHFVSQDWGPDALSTKHTLLATEWELSPSKSPEAPPTLAFVGREYTYKAGHLEPTRDPVRRRALSVQLDAERTSAAKRDFTSTPRKLLEHATTTRAPFDEPSATRRDAVIRGLTLDEPGLDVHLEGADGWLGSLSTAPDDGPPLRMGDSKAKRLYPLAYAPFDAEHWLLGRAVSVTVDSGKRASGTVWVTR